MKVDPAFRIAGNIQHQLPMWDIDNIGIDSRNGNRLDCRKHNLPQPDNFSIYLALTEPSTEVKHYRV